MSKSDFYNAEGYPEPTAYGVIAEENAIEAEARYLLKVLRYIARKAGFELRTVDLKYKDGRTFKLTR